MCVTCIGCVDAPAFWGASSFNGDLSSWDVSSVTTLDSSKQALDLSLCRTLLGEGVWPREAKESVSVLSCFRRRGRGKKAVEMSSAVIGAYEPRDMKRQVDISIASSSLSASKLSLSSRSGTPSSEQGTE